MPPASILATHLPFVPTSGRQGFHRRVGELTRELLPRRAGVWEDGIKERLDDLDDKQCLHRQVQKELAVLAGRGHGRGLPPLAGIDTSRIHDPAPPPSPPRPNYTITPGPNLVSRSVSLYSFPTVV